MLADAERIATAAVDRLVIRAAQMTGVGLLVVFAGAVVLLFVARRVFAP